MTDERNEHELIVYTDEGGESRLQLRAEGGTVWLTAPEIAELFAITPGQVAGHLYDMRHDGELHPESVRDAASGGAPVTLYDLDAILGVGYRVRSRRGARFRLWATTVLRDYLSQGYALAAARLEEPGWDYNDELLERIREIRASEVRLYGKVRDLLSLSEDYRPNTPEVTELYRRMQNELLYAVTEHTAAELILDRADPDAPNMGTTSWRGDHVRKADANVAKNYLTREELAQLNRVVAMFLESVEQRVLRWQGMRLADWGEALDAFLRANGLPVLEGEGGVTPEYAKRVAHERYAEFDARRRDDAAPGPQLSFRRSSGRRPPGSARTRSR